MPAAELRVMVIFGTRPEAIKVAPVLAELARAPHCIPIAVVSGQHRGLLDQVLDVFGIRPDDDLDLLRPGQTLVEVTTRVLSGLTEVLSRHQPDAVLVQGDTTTAFAAALAAFYAGVPVVHLEAGLRSGDLLAPFPEELNRKLTSQIAALHLAPTPAARSNLEAEGIRPERILVTGNTVIDALRWAVARDVPFSHPRLTDLDADDRPVLLVTAHRRESWGAGMESIGKALRNIARRERGLEVVFPMHPNPVVREAITPLVESEPNVRLVEPLEYGEFARLIARATIILTDSGGLQEEGPSLGKPVLVMRETTERPEAVQSGNARLVGTDTEVIETAVVGLLHDADDYQRMASAINPYGDGKAAERAVAGIGYLLSGTPAPAEFKPD